MFMQREFVKLLSNNLYQSPDLDNISSPFIQTWGRNNIDCTSIVTCYRLDGLGIESQWELDFPHPSRPGPSRFRSNAEVEERVELWLYSHSVASGQVIGWKYLTVFNINFSFTAMSERNDTKPCTEQGFYIHVLENIPLIWTSMSYSQIWLIFISALPLQNKTWN
jgi:hypothetical protein